MLSLSILPPCRKRYTLNLGDPNDRNVATKLVQIGNDERLGRVRGGEADTSQCQVDWRDASQNTIVPSLSAPFSPFLHKGLRELEGSDLGRGALEV